MPAYLVPCLLLAASVHVAAPSPPGPVQEGPRLELPDGAAARAWAAVRSDTEPAALAPEVLRWATTEGARAEGGWRQWGAWVMRASSGGDGAAEARAALCLFARAQGRARDAWEHFAALADHPAHVAAVAARLLPGVPLGATLEAGGIPAPLAEGTLLEPLLPPASGAPDASGRVEWRTATWHGLRVGGGVLDVAVTVETNGVQVDVDATGGEATRLRVRLAPPEEHEIEVEYLDWERLEDSDEVPILGSEVEIAVAPGDDGHALYGRTVGVRAALPQGTVRALPRQIALGGLRLGAPPDDPEAERLAGLAAVLAEVLDVPVTVAPLGQGDAWTGTEVPLPPPGREREAVLAYLASRVERWADARTADTAVEEDRAVGPWPLPAHGRVVLFGDSLARDPEVCGVLAHVLAATRPDGPPRVENAGLEGDGPTRALERLEVDVLEREPALVLVAFGNDPSPDDAAQFTDALTEVVARVQAGTHARVALVAPWPFGADASDAARAEARAARGTLVRRVAESAGVALLEPARAVAVDGLEAGVGWAADGLAPDAAGALSFVLAVADRLQPVAPIGVRIAPLAAGQRRLVQRVELTRLPVALPAGAVPLARALELEARWNPLRLELDGFAAGTWKLTTSTAELLRFETDAQGRILARTDLDLAAGPWNAAAAEALAWALRRARTEAMDVRDQFAGVAALQDAGRRRDGYAGLREVLHLAWLKLDTMQAQADRVLSARGFEVALERVD